MSGGIFTISLDFELHWGVFDKLNRENRTNCYRNTLQAVPQMLKLFAEHDVHVTWATVGSLFAKDRNEWESWKPATLPEYENKRYCPYTWVNKHGLSEKDYPSHFAPDVVQSILNYPGQELGTHTFSHLFCLEKQKGVKAFEEDLKSVKKAAEKFNHNIVSIVFPRNQSSLEHLKICYEQGIKVVRSNPDIWFWRKSKGLPHKISSKLFRMSDSYFPVGTKMAYGANQILSQPGMPLQVPGGRFFLPWSPEKGVKNKLRLIRVIQELKNAAKRNECYHLWWHPENFGDYPEENLKDLKVLLEKYSLYKKKYGMRSWNMGEYATYFEEKDAFFASQKRHPAPVV